MSQLILGEGEGHNTTWTTIPDKLTGGHIACQLTGDNRDLRGDFRDYWQGY